MKSLSPFKRVAIALLSCALAFSCTKEAPDVAPAARNTYEVAVTDFSATRGTMHIGGKLYLPKDVEGRKAAVILCHGIFGSHKSLAVYAESAASMGIAAVCFDFCGGPAGASLSDGTSKENSILSELQDLQAVYETLRLRTDINLSRIAVMGASQGGLVASMFAAENPSSVKALGLFYPAFNLPDLVRTIFNTLYKGDIDKMPETIGILDYTFSKKYVQDACTLYPFNIIGNYNGPVNILHGEKDFIVPLENSEKAVEIYKDASLTVLKDQGHIFNNAGKEQAAENVEKWLLKVL